MKSSRTFLRSLLLWAMLPLTLLAGSPRPLCLCSNGDIKIFCRGSTAQHSCCPTSTASSEKSCCRAGCCGANKASANKTAASSATCRCTRFVGMPEPTPKATSVLMPNLEIVWQVPEEGMLSHSSLTAAPFRLIGDSPPPLSGRDVLTKLGRSLV